MNVKQGDLAIVVGAHQTPEMIGRIVEVIAPHVHGQAVHGVHYKNVDFSWVIRDVGGRDLPVRSIKGKLFFAKERVFSDKFLKPVSGLPDTDSVDTEVTKPKIIEKTLEKA